jgi:hypothetical protein
MGEIGKQIGWSVGSLQGDGFRPIKRNAQQFSIEALRGPAIWLAQDDSSACELD